MTQQEAGCHRGFRAAKMPESAFEAGVNYLEYARGTGASGREQHAQVAGHRRGAAHGDVGGFPQLFAEEICVASEGAGLRVRFGQVLCEAGGETAKDFTSARTIHYGFCRALRFFGQKPVRAEAGCSSGRTGHSNRRRSPVAEFLLAPTPHTEAVDFIKDKPAVTRRVFDQLLPELQARAFTVTGIEVADTLQRVRDIVAELPAGGDWEELKTRIIGEVSPFFVTSDDPEEKAKQEYGAERRAELLLRVHGGQAYAAASYRLMDAQRDLFPYWQYLSLHDGRVRPTHAALDKIALPCDADFWKTHFPPWEWMCRCQAVPLSEEDVQAIRDADEDRPPEARQLLEGPALEKLERENIIVRHSDPAAGKGAPTPFNVQSPAEAGKPGAFRWQPGELKLSLEDLRSRYDAPVWEKFEGWAKQQPLRADGHVSVWNWLNSKPVSPYAPHELSPATGGPAGSPHSADERAAFSIGSGVGEALYAGVRTPGLGASPGRIAGAEIGAVGAGRKPLYHEQLGEAAAQAAELLTQGLPEGVLADAREGHLIVYRPESVRAILDSDPAFYRPAGEDDAAAMWKACLEDAQGELMGYGARTLSGARQVTVQFTTRSGLLLAGFRAPLESAVDLARERGLDYERGLGEPVMFYIREEGR